MKRPRNIAILFIVLAIFFQSVVPLLASETRAPTKVQVDAIVERIRQALRDPYSVRDASISTVGHYDNGFGEAGDFVCVRLNAKNRYGAYVGLKTSLATFNPDGTLSKPVAFLSARALCSSVSFRPFKELDRLKAL